MTNLPGSTTLSPADSSTNPLFIFLGASNLARGYTALVKAAQNFMHPQPCEFLGAIGPGRGYCAPGGFLKVRYPPIATCGILKAAKIKAAHSSRVVALITDIGNDIVYGIPPSLIIRTLSEMIQDLSAMGAEISITSISVDLEKDVGECGYRVLRKIYFPFSDTPFAEAAQATKEINHFIEGLSSQGIHVIRELDRYQGLDRIHFSLLHSSRLWSLIASEMFHSPNDKTRRLVSWRLMRKSLIANCIRLFGTDLFQLREREPDLF
jgi:hypothetical protein